MKLQILVPHYKEREDEIKPLLDSIAIQIKVDFEDIGVIIASDGDSIPINEVLFEKYPFEIQYYKLEKHCSVSMARNFVMDKATADYIMFCDADDMFYHVCALWLLFREFNFSSFDALISNFIEENFAYNPITGNKEKNYITHNIDSTFVHGKVYNRKYLEANDIKFNEALTIHEDSYFNFLAQHLTTSDKIKYCSIPFYLWKWRDNSVCRHDPKYILKTYNNMLESSTELVNELLKRGKGNFAEEIVTSIVYESYFTLNKEEWINQENREYRINTEKRFK